MASRLTVPDVLEAIEEAIEDGETDRLDGGVPRQEIADRLDRSIRSKRLRSLLDHAQERGDVVEVWGAAPETGQPRTSYLPVEEAPDPPPESDLERYN